MSYRKLMGAAAAVGALVTAVPAQAAHAAADVTIQVTNDDDYSACATVTRSNGGSVTATLAASGYQQQGLATGQIAGTQTKTGLGSATPCTAGGFTTQNGFVQYTVNYVAGTSTGSFPVYCASVNFTMTCTSKRITIPDPLG